MQAEPAAYPEIETEPAPVLTTLGSTGVHEFTRYLIASAAALAIDTGSLVFLTEYIGVPYLISGAAAFLLGLATIYVLSILWVFEHRRVRSAWKEFFLFTVIGIAGLLINEAMLWIFTGLLGLYYLVSKFLSVLVVFTWNFSIRKFWLFR